MKHKMGNSVRCDECLYYKERFEGEKMKYDCTGWCHNKKAHGINGHRPAKVAERRQIAGKDSCHLWRDAESGNTKYEVLTGYKEPYDGTKINFCNS